jgi:hypothetical protein
MWGSRHGASLGAPPETHVAAIATEGSLWGPPHGVASISPREQFYPRWLDLTQKDSSCMILPTRNRQNRLTAQGSRLLDAWSLTLRSIYNYCKRNPLLEVLTLRRWPSIAKEAPRCHGPPRCAAACNPIPTSRHNPRPQTEEGFLPSQWRYLLVVEKGPHSRTPG